MRFNRLLLGTGVVLLSSSALAQDPIDKPDGSWVSVSGTVTSTSPETFGLDYGDGIVTVEMDDWDDWGDAYVVADGDKVTVYGKVDDDLYEVGKIEASSVYIEDLNSYFYASSADEETLGAWAVDIPIVPSSAHFVGEVETVNKQNGTFTIDTGLSELTVDTTPLLYNPLDDVGYQQIQAGDRVSIEGIVDRDFFDGRELEADSIITLDDSAS